MSNYNYNKHYKKMEKSKYNENKKLYYEKKNKTKLSKKEMAKYRYYQSIIENNIEKDTLKDLSNKIMNIIEDINEKGMNNKRYINIMNILMKIHNYNTINRKEMLNDNHNILLLQYNYLYNEVQNILGYIDNNPSNNPYDPLLP